MSNSVNLTHFLSVFTDLVFLSVVVSLIGIGFVFETLFAAHLVASEFVEERGEQVGALVDAHNVAHFSYRVHRKLWRAHVDCRNSEVGGSDWTDG